jgi:hypothetical protein
MRSKKERTADAARKNFFTSTTQRPFYVKPKDPPPPAKKLKMFKKTKIVHNPKCDPAPWMKPQTTLPEARLNLEREKYKKEQIKAELRRTERFYNETISSLCTIEDAEVRRAISATIKMGESEMNKLRKRLNQHRFDLKSDRKLRILRREENHGDLLVERAQAADDIETGKHYLREAEMHFAAAGAIEKQKSLQRFWANRSSADEVSFGTTQ